METNTYWTQFVVYVWTKEHGSGWFHQCLHCNTRIADYGIV